MHLDKESLERDFLCPKCHHRGAFVQDVQLGRSVARVIPLAAAHFHAASCRLCGYTEFYQQAIAEKTGEEAPCKTTKLAKETD